MFCGSPLSGPRRTPATITTEISRVAAPLVEADVVEDPILLLAAAPDSYEHAAFRGFGEEQQERQQRSCPEFVLPGLTQQRQQQPLLPTPSYYSNAMDVSSGAIASPPAPPPPMPSPAGIPGSPGEVNGPEGRTTAPGARPGGDYTGGAAGGAATDVATPLRFTSLAEGLSRPVGCDGRMMAVALAAAPTATTSVPRDTAIARGSAVTGMPKPPPPPPPSQSCANPATPQRSHRAGSGRYPVSWPPAQPFSQMSLCTGGGARGIGAGLGEPYSRPWCSADGVSVADVTSPPPPPRLPVSGQWVTAGGGGGVPQTLLMPQPPNPPMQMLNFSEYQASSFSQPQPQQPQYGPQNTQHPQYPQFHQNQNQQPQGPQQGPWTRTAGYSQPYRCQQQQQQQQQQPQAPQSQPPQHYPYQHQQLQQHQQQLSYASQAPHRSSYPGEPYACRQHNAPGGDGPPRRISEPPPSTHAAAGPMYGNDGRSYPMYGNCDGGCAMYGNGGSGRAGSAAAAYCDGRLRSVGGSNDGAGGCAGPGSSCGAMRTPIPLSLQPAATQYQQHPQQQQQQPSHPQQQQTCLQQQHQPPYYQQQQSCHQYQQQHHHTASASGCGQLSSIWDLDTLHGPMGLGATQLMDIDGFFASPDGGGGSGDGGGGGGTSSFADGLLNIDRDVAAAEEADGGGGSKSLSGRKRGFFQWGPTEAGLHTHPTEASQGLPSHMSYRPTGPSGMASGLGGVSAASASTAIMALGPLASTPPPLLPPPQPSQLLPPQQLPHGHMRHAVGSGFGAGGGGGNGGAWNGGRLCSSGDGSGVGGGGTCASGLGFALPQPTPATAFGGGAPVSALLPTMHGSHPASHLMPPYCNANGGGGPATDGGIRGACAPGQMVPVGDSSSAALPSGLRRPSHIRTAPVREIIRGGAANSSLKAAIELGSPNTSNQSAASNLQGDGGCGGDADGGSGGGRGGENGPANFARGAGPVGGETLAAMQPKKAARKGNTTAGGAKSVGTAAATATTSSTRTPGARGPAVRNKNGGTSRFRGVTRHRWTQKWEAHLWDSTVARKKTGPGGRTRGKQVYLGGYNSELEAARAYDMAAIVYWGEAATTNFPSEEYQADLAELAQLDKESVVAMLRRRSTGFSRGVSRFRGVTRHHQPGRWEARIGKVAGNRYLYLGSFEAEEAAAMAYDYVALRRRGARAVTNFDPRTYTDSATGLLLPFECLPQTVRDGIAPSCLAQLATTDIHTRISPDGPGSSEEEEEEEEDEDEEEVEAADSEGGDARGAAAGGEGSTGGGGGNQRQGDGVGAPEGQRRRRRKGMAASQVPPPQLRPLQPHDIRQWQQQQQQQQQPSQQQQSSQQQQQQLLFTRPNDGVDRMDTGWRQQRQQQSSAEGLSSVVAAAAVAASAAAVCGAPGLRLGSGSGTARSLRVSSKSTASKYGMTLYGIAGQLERRDSSITGASLATEVALLPATPSAAAAPPPPSPSGLRPVIKHLGQLVSTLRSPTVPYSTYDYAKPVQHSLYTFPPPSNQQSPEHQQDHHQVRHSTGLYPQYQANEAPEQSLQQQQPEVGPLRSNPAYIAGFVGFGSGGAAGCGGVNSDGGGGSESLLMAAIRRTGGDADMGMAPAAAVNASPFGCLTAAGPAANEWHTAGGAGGRNGPLAEMRSPFSGAYLPGQYDIYPATAAEATAWQLEPPAPAAAAATAPPPPLSPGECAIGAAAVTEVPVGADLVSYSSGESVDLGAAAVDMGTAGLIESFLQSTIPGADTADAMGPDGEYNAVATAADVEEEAAVAAAAAQEDAAAVC